MRRYETAEDLPRVRRRMQHLLNRAGRAPKASNERLKCLAEVDRLSYVAKQLRDR